MNRELKRVTILIFAMFLTLMTSTTIVQAFQNENLGANKNNSRSLYASYSTERGPILVDGRPVAQSVPSNDHFKFQRTYPNGPLYAPVTGYFTLGKGSTMIEHSLTDELSGTANSQFLQKVDSIITGQEPKGASVELTIDPTAQQAAFDALGDYQGAIVVTQPKTGRILAMVSKPTFDPNLRTNHDPDAAAKAYDTLNADLTKPLVNRAIKGDLNPPGSVFKLVVASAAFESGKYTPESLLPNPKTFQLPGSNLVIRNAGGDDCGGGETASIATAVELSCNVPLAKLGLELGSKALLEQAKKYGFNVSYDIPMSVEPSVFPTVMDEAQTALSSFGQFEVRATPLQMAMVSAGIANGGIIMQPNLVEAVRNPDLSPIRQFQPKVFSQAISARSAAWLTAIMVGGVNTGAASNARISGVEVAGKTGTAENAANDPYTFWFTGFAPAGEPRYAITVLVENGGGLGQSGFSSLITAPIAKKVLEAVLKK